MEKNEKKEGKFSGTKGEVKQKKPVGINFGLAGWRCGAGSRVYNGSSSISEVRLTRPIRFDDRGPRQCTITIQWLELSVDVLI